MLIDGQSVQDAVTALADYAEAAALGYAQRSVVVSVDGYFETNVAEYVESNTAGERSGATGYAPSTMRGSGPVGQVRDVAVERQEFAAAEKIPSSRIPDRVREAHAGAALPRPPNDDALGVLQRRLEALWELEAKTMLRVVIDAAEHQCIVHDERCQGHDTISHGAVVMLQMCEPSGLPNVDAHELRGLRIPREAPDAGRASTRCAC